VSQLSSDNGCYVRGYKDGTFRVAYAMGIDSIDYYEDLGDADCMKAIEVLIFGRSPVFTNEDEAVEYAFKLHDEYGYTEYGVTQLYQCSFDYPLDMSEERANQLLKFEQDSY
jgi:hypothetical protein